MSARPVDPRLVANLLRELARLLAETPCPDFASAVLNAALVADTLNIAADVAAMRRFQTIPTPSCN